jgi:hypothetical protein
MSLEEKFLSEIEIAGSDSPVDIQWMEVKIAGYHKAQNV